MTTTDTATSDLDRLRDTAAAHVSEGDYDAYLYYDPNVLCDRLLITERCYDGAVYVYSREEGALAGFVPLAETDFRGFAVGDAILHVLSRLFAKLGRASADGELKAENDELRARLDAVRGGLEAAFGWRVERFGV